MRKLKRIKDPIYGYIEIPADIVHRIIDTPAFQRLRRIIQTSYSPLYPSATHNRFVHSLGVYYLGRILTKNIRKNFPDRPEDDWEKEREKILELFEFACLLHDVGHCPFSHTGEALFKTGGKVAELHNKLAEVVRSEEFAQELKKIEENNEEAKPHEIISSIIGIDEYEWLFSAPEGENKKEDVDKKEFFARMICGYKYKNNEGKVTSFRNCMIEFLNSKIIDVDKLDYLLRDAYLLGYDTVSIDYQRLLGAVSLRENESHNAFICVYGKGAVSVLENVVYAHDSERKWIQNQPVVRYEMYLLTEALKKMNNKVIKKSVEKKTVFSIDSLTDSGYKLTEDLVVKRFCDDDALFLMKNYGDDEAKLFFDRSKWMRPLWKSELEFRVLFGEQWTKEKKNTFFYILNNLFDRLGQVDCLIIDDNTIQKLNEEIVQAKEAVRVEDRPIHREKFEKSLHDAEKQMNFCNSFKKIADKYKFVFRYLILPANPFVSGFSKKEFGAIKIETLMSENYCCFDGVTNVLKGGNESEYPIYFFFCDCNKVSVSKARLAKELLESLFSLC